MYYCIISQYIYTSYTKISLQHSVINSDHNMFVFCCTAVSEQNEELEREGEEDVLLVLFESGSIRQGFSKDINFDELMQVSYHVIPYQLVSDDYAGIIPYHLLSNSNTSIIPYQLVSDSYAGIIPYQLVSDSYAGIKPFIKQFICRYHTIPISKRFICRYYTIPFIKQFIYKYHIIPFSKRFIFRYHTN